MHAKLLEVKKRQPYVKYKVIIVGVCFRAIAEEIKVLSDEFASV